LATAPWKSSELEAGMADGDVDRVIEALASALDL
jgi:hypothetical protein